MTPRPANPHLSYDILRATADIIEEKGPEKLTMREVAERLGYSATTIYLYFKSKDELLGQTVDRAFEWFGDAMDAAEPENLTPDVLRLRTRAYAEWGLEHPGMYRLMFERRTTAAVSQDNARARRRAWRRHKELIEQLMETGHLRCVEGTDLMANMIWATLHGLVSLAISGRLFGPVDAAQVRDGVLGMVDAAFEQWMRAWSVTPAESDLYGSCEIGGGDGQGCGDGCGEGEGCGEC